MRSRDGNFSLLFTIFSVIFLFFTPVSAEEYLISYRYVIKDSILYNENMNISKAMTRCDGTLGNTIILQNNKFKSLKNIITSNINVFMQYIHKLGLNVDYKDTTTNSQNHSTTILTLKTTCFKVDFNDNFAKITSLK